MPSVRRTVLIIHPGSLGDCLLALPAIRAVRTSFPHHRLVLLAQESAAHLFHVCGEVDDTLSLDGPILADLLAGSEAISPEMRAFLLDCEMVIAWMRDAQNELTSILSSFDIRSIVASPHLSAYGVLHHSDRFLETVKSVVSVPIGSQGLRLPPQTMNDADARLREVGVPTSRSLIIIHPGSGSPYKCVAPRLLADLVHWYRDRNATPLIVGGPADIEQVTLLDRECEGHALTLHTVNLQLMAGILARADLFIGHDSALTHMAAALSISTVALFGPTNVDRWAPRGSHIRIVTGSACRCDGWDKVRSCRERFCLQIPFEQIIAACATLWPSLI